MKRENIIKGMKLTLAALIAILISQALGLQYVPTAGIITVLSIQNTKKDTLRTAARRSMAFFCALILCAGCFSLFGYTVFAFGVYLFFFATLCLACGWAEAIAMDSVLITHFLTAGHMEPALILNETALFLIGTVMGILANGFLRKKEEEFNARADEVDKEIKNVIKRMSVWIMHPDKSGYTDSCFTGLKDKAAQTKRKAYENHNNTFFSKPYHEIDYIEMREKQIEVLQHMYASVKMLRSVPAQAEKVSQILSVVERDYDKGNPVDGLLEQLAQTFAEMEREELPGNRREFEDRAVLYYIMKQLEELLGYKKEYMKKYGKKGDS